MNNIKIIGLEGELSFSEKEFLKTYLKQVSAEEKQCINLADWKSLLEISSVSEIEYLITALVMADFIEKAENLITYLQTLNRPLNIRHLKIDNITCSYIVNARYCSFKQIRLEDINYISTFSSCDCSIDTLIIDSDFEDADEEIREELKRCGTSVNKIIRK